MQNVSFSDEAVINKDFGSIWWRDTLSFCHAFLRKRKIVKRAECKHGESFSELRAFPGWGLLFVAASQGFLEKRKQSLENLSIINMEAPCW